MGATACTSIPITLSINFAAGQSGMSVPLATHADHLHASGEAPPLIRDSQLIAVAHRGEQRLFDRAGRFLVADSQPDEKHLGRVLRNYACLPANDVGAIRL